MLTTEGRCNAISRHVACDRVFCLRECDAALHELDGARERVMH
jgi:hypothetical protein